MAPAPPPTHRATRAWALMLLALPLLLWGTCRAETLTVGFLAGGGGLGDQSYNDMTWVGLAKARKQYGIRLTYAPTEENDASRRQALETLLTGGATVVVCNGAGLIPVVKAVATQRPEITFIINDHLVQGFANIVSTTFANHEGSFLAGVLAGAMTKTRRIGFIGGVRMCAIRSFHMGFTQGVRFANPDATVITRFIAEKGDYSGFSNPDAGYALADTLYREGTDIIYAVAGLSGNGVIQAARAHSRYVIGVDADQDHMARGLVLTSMMKRLDRASLMEVEKILTHRFQPGESPYNLENGGVSLSPMRYTREMIPEAIHRQLKLAESDIIAGELTVHRCEEAPP
ncbi:BMP family lipoprotein [Desulfoluna spongiiphila]|uniref:Nucleoside-binding protein n=1 Tax=Desulfoluna spongiiphila TaxID=419481 RepID=A0A1G5J4I0_9BACT|nr:BMP family ABC transporter substrate-binding protein [Desulfoluna spongiiphila]SCY83167.1 nucleoside-binding protein [Desulfoluna spongiiphila]